MTSLHPDTLFLLIQPVSKFLATIWFLWLIMNLSSTKPIRLFTVITRSGWPSTMRLWFQDFIFISIKYDFVHFNIVPASPALFSLDSASINDGSIASPSYMQGKPSLHPFSKCILSIVVGGVKLRPMKSTGTLSHRPYCQGPCNLIGNIRHLCMIMT